MVNYLSAALDATFSALGDPTRRAIPARLARGESSVTALAAPFPVSLSALAKLLRVLERAGLLARERHGSTPRCRPVARPMKEAARSIARNQRFREDRLEALARYLDESQKQEERTWLPQNRARKPLSRSGGRNQIQGGTRR